MGKELTANQTPKVVLYAEDDAAIWESIVGQDNVFAVGSRLKATATSNNKIRISDGIACVGGHFWRIEYGKYDELTIENGQTGQNRNDMIVLRITTTGPKGTDEIKLVVVKGTPGGGDPALTSENIYTAGKVRDLPLYRVRLEGINVVAVEQLFKVTVAIGDVRSYIDAELAEIRKEMLNNVYTKDAVDEMLALKANTDHSHNFIMDKDGGHRHYMHWTGRALEFAVDGTKVRTW